MTEQTAPFRDLTVDEIKKLVDEGRDVVDVREDWEWTKGHLPGARHVVLSSILANPTGHTFKAGPSSGARVGSGPPGRPRWPARWAGRTEATFAAGPRPGGERGLPWG